jgi:hypothetical protein
LEEAFEEPIASKSTGSRICEDIRERYRQWCRRRLEAHDIVYLFLDAIVRHEALFVRAGCKAPPPGCHSSLVGAEGSLTPELRGRAGAALTTTRRAETVGPYARG